MAERAKYEKWLRELEAKKQSTPAHVYERVRGDYTERLDAVLDQLREHTSSMQTHARTLMARLRELEAAEQDLKDEHAEQELRAQVGELTPGEWETISRKAQRAIAKVQEDQEAVAADLNRIRELLEGDSGEEEDEDSERAEPPRHSTDFNELEFLKSVVGTATPAASRTPPSSSKAAAPGARPSGERASEPAPKRPTPAAPPPAVSEPVAKKSDAGETKPAAPKPAAAPAQPKLQVTSDSPLTFSSDVSAGEKTLKCPECGTMNSPNEWYCEKCGAELANI